MMGEIADMMLDGTLDCETGEYIGDRNKRKYGNESPGFPISYEKRNRKQSDELSGPFEWKDRKDNFHKIKDMETRHLFFTLRMIWNHAAPQEIQLEPFKRYRFGPFYGPAYIKKAVREISAELNNRNDLTPYFRASLDFMATHYCIFEKHYIEA